MNIWQLLDYQKDIAQRKNTSESDALPERLVDHYYPLYEFLDKALKAYAITISTLMESKEITEFSLIDWRSSDNKSCQLMMSSNGHVDLRVGERSVNQYSWHIARDETIKRLKLQA